jgi:tRNA(fMet)-specific endonuclease VapC
MRYLLDANSVIALLNNRESKAAQKARQHHPTDIGISAIVVYELYYGAFQSQRSVQNVALIDSLLFEMVDFDKEDARQAGEVRALLASRGTPIGAYDILIAGQAKSRNVVLVTHNTREFSRVPGLKIEDWHA